MRTIIRKKKFLRLLAKKAGFTFNDTIRFWKAVQEIFKEAIESDTELNITGFGHLYVTDIAERICKNPKTGERYMHPPNKRVVFTVSGTLSDTMREVSKRHYRSAERRQQAIAEMMEKLNTTK